MRVLAIAALSLLIACSSKDDDAVQLLEAGVEPVDNSADGGAQSPDDASSQLDARFPPTGDAAQDAAQPGDAGHGDDAGNTGFVPRARPIDRGQLAGTLSGGNGVSLTPNLMDLAPYGYVQEEYVLTGSAHAYAAQGELGLDGKWAAVPNGKAPFRTRILVLRPALPQHFNGTAFVEWLNVTGSIDTAVGFTLAREELLRGGYAYVGVSVQKAGVDSLKTFDAARYGSLEHPGDGYGYDIFAQAGAAVGWPGEIDPLHGLRVERLLGYGESQSAMRMITFVNAVQPLTKVFDGIIIHSRAGWGAAVGTESDALLGNGKPVQVRNDLQTRVLQFFTESEVFLPLGPAYAARQPDSDRLRTWEVAGTAHADARMLGKGTDIGCGLANEGHQHVVLKAGIRAMHRWLLDGSAPPVGAPFEVNAARTAIARDARGNALGGVRNPAIDVPVAVLSGEPTPQNAWNPSCMLFGQTLPFTTVQLRELYPTHQAYVDKVVASARASREAGFVLPEEEASIVAEAMAARVPE